MVAVAQQRDYSPEKRVAYARGARAEQAKRSLAEFVRQGWGQAIGEEDGTPLEWSWHLDAICTNVQGQLMDWLAAKRQPGQQYHYDAETLAWLESKRPAGSRVREQNARYHFPPGTLKSRIISVYAPSWMWLWWPKWSVLCLSANDDVAKRDASFMRDIVKSDWYRTSFRPPWELRGDIDAKGKFQNTAGGFRVSRKLVSKITGGRADAWIIDDPDDAYEVYSEASRRETQGKFDNAIYNRLNDPRISLRMLMQQHVHPDDLGFHWSRKGRQMVVSVPMSYDPKIDDKTPYTPDGYDPRTEKGQTLQPERFTDEYLAEEKDRLGSAGYALQYDQTGDLFKAGPIDRGWFRFCRLPGQPEQIWTRPAGTHRGPSVELKRKKETHRKHISDLELDWMLVSVDATFGEVNDQASQVGLLVIGGKGADRFVLDDRSKVMTFPQMLDAIVTFEDPEARKGKIVGGIVHDWPQAKRVLIEKKANGAAIIQTLHSKIAGLIPYTLPGGGKVARARAMAPAIESGNVYVLEGMPWVKDFLDEQGMFPNARYDDRVDALSQAMEYAGSSLDMVSKWEAAVK